MGQTVRTFSKFAGPLDRLCPTPRRRLIAVKRDTLMTTQQIELGFVNRPATPVSIRHERRRGRAQWWFHQMRLAVDRSLEWKSAPNARPEQIYMPLQSR